MQVKFEISSNYLKIFLMGVLKIDRKGIPSRLVQISVDLNTGGIRGLSDLMDEKDTNLYSVKYSKVDPSLDLLIKISNLGFNPLWFLTGQGEKRLYQIEYPQISASAGNLKEPITDYNVENIKLKAQVELLTTILTQKDKTP